MLPLNREQNVCSNIDSGLKTLQRSSTHWRQNKNLCSWACLFFFTVYASQELCYTVKNSKSNDLKKGGDESHVLFTYRLSTWLQNMK